MAEHRKSVAIALLVVFFAVQVAIAAGGLYVRNVRHDGYGGLPFTWQMYSGR